MGKAFTQCSKGVATNKNSYGGHKLLPGSWSGEGGLEEGSRDGEAWLVLALQKRCCKIGKIQSGILYFPSRVMICTRTVRTDSGNCSVPCWVHLVCLWFL